MDQLYTVSRYQEQEEDVEEREHDKTNLLDVLLSSAKSRKLEYEKVRIKDEHLKAPSEQLMFMQFEHQSEADTVSNVTGVKFIIDRSKAKEFDLNSEGHRKRRKVDENLTEEVCRIGDINHKDDRSPKNRKKKKREHAVEGTSYCKLEESIIFDPHNTDQVCPVSEDDQIKYKEKKKRKKNSSKKHSEVVNNLGITDDKTNCIISLGEESTKYDSSHSIDIKDTPILEDNTSGTGFLQDLNKSLKGRGKSDSDSFDESPLDVNENPIVNYDEREKDFIVIGEIQGQKKEKVKRVLPDWLANPTIIDVDLQRKGDILNDCPQLDPRLIQSLGNSGITNLFPVQKAVIPWLLNGCLKVHCFHPRDLCVSAPTGSGKTLAFVLPIIHSLKERVVCSVRALVVLPVRSLAVQVFRVFEQYCKGTSLKVALVVGQKTFAQEQLSLVKQGIRGFHSLVDIIVATPGRLIDHINRTEGFSLKNLRFLIIDEADRMMEEIQHGWLVEVEKSVYGDIYKKNNCACYGSTMHQKFPTGSLTACSYSHICDPFQKLLYSATLSQDPEKLHQLSLFHPILFTSVVKGKGSEMANKEGVEIPSQQEVQGDFIGKYSTPAELQEFFTVCETSVKPLIVWYLIKSHGFKRVLCFTHSVESTHRLRLVLEQLGSYKVREFSSNYQGISQKVTLKKFVAGKINILVCSDAMARGMDVKNVDCVISYDPPRFIKNYIHRIGRTARAGRSGVAITLLERKHVKNFQTMVKSAGKFSLQQIKVPTFQLESFQDKYKSALAEVARIVEEERKKLRLSKIPGKKLKFKRKQTLV